MESGRHYSKDEFENAHKLCSKDFPMETRDMILYCSKGRHEGKNIQKAFIGKKP